LQSDVVPKFLIDECLSPDLAVLARERGFVESSHDTAAKGATCLSVPITQFRV
jgi:hypothetical protein